MSERWQKISALYHAALERDDTERAAFLREACGTDDEMRVEIESLLKREGATDGFLNAPAVDLAGSRMTGSLSPDLVGQQIGSYKILEFVGAGGMGRVYRARDVRLGRDVALKMLPAEFSSDAERRARFEREARLLAALNHPNIAQIHGLEESNGVLALAMEFVAGPTLSDVIRQSSRASTSVSGNAGGLNVEQVLTLARQIAAGLAAAHEKGIIHRDLKPANIKITDDGTIKVLDFGLAKAMAGEPSNTDGQSLPTLTQDGTRAGAILGTVAYMSPEQARGGLVDKRTDIWAFGCVLYEMLTATPAFAKDTLSDTLAAVLSSQPDWTRLGQIANTPLGLLVRKSLEKDRQARIGDFSTVSFVIDGFASLPEAARPDPNRSARSRRPWLLAGFAAGVVLAGIGAAIWWNAQATDLRPLVRLNVDVPPGVSPEAPARSPMLLSPDGTRIVFATEQGLMTRRLDEAGLTQLAGTEGSTRPFFSAEGKWIGFFAGGKLKKVSTDGGPVTTLCDAPSSYGTASWSDDDQIVGTLGSSRGLSRVSAAGGNPVPVMKVDPKEPEIDYSPQVLPGGKAVLFAAISSESSRRDIEVLLLADSSRKTVHRGGAMPRYLPSGHLIYLSGRNLYAVPFDLNRLETYGTPTAVAGDAGSLAGFSRDGSLMYVTAPGAPMSTIRLLSPNTSSDPLGRVGAYVDPHISADGERIAVGLRESSRPDLWIHDVKRNKLSQLTFGDALPYSLFTPDGRYVVFTGRTSHAMAWTRADGAGGAQPLLESRNFQWRGSFTPDGRRFAFFELTSENYFDIWTVPVEVSDSGLKAGRPERFLNTPTVDERHPAFSPDGRWLAFTSNQSGQYEIWVRTFPDSGLRWQVSSGGGVTPLWSRTTPELFFRSPSNKAMAATYSVKGGSFLADKPRVWSDQTLTNVGPLDSSFDLAPDGKHLVALVPDEEQRRGQVVFLQNFFDELRRRVPVKPR